MALNRSKNITLIAKELGSTASDAENFIYEVDKILREFTHSLVVLEAVRQIKIPEKVTPQIVACFIEPQTYGLDQIAEELGVERKAAAHFCRGVRGSLGIRVAYSTILNALWQIENKDNLKPGAVASQIIGPIAEALGKNAKAAKIFCRKVSQILKLDISTIHLNIILEAINRIENQNEISPETVASLIHQNINKTSVKEVRKPGQHNIRSRSVAANPMTSFEIRSREAAQKLRGKLQITLPKSKIKALKEFGRACWNELTQERRYQVPSAGRAEIMPFATLEHLINLELVRFIQEGIKAPGVYIEFEFKNESTIGAIKINSSGHIEGFHKFIGSDGAFECLIEAVALSYYRDLVTPGTVYSYEPGRGSPRSHSNNSVDPRKLPRSRSIPTKKSDASVRERQVHNLHEWYEAQHWFRHQVVGHTRWVRKGFTASVEKQQQAREAGVNLSTGYTWVVEHERSQPIIGLQLDSSGNLSTRTLFLPPDRASIELNELLA